MPKRLLFVFILLKHAFVFSQQFTVHGVIVNSKLEPLPFTNVQVKNTPIITSTNTKGSFSVLLEQGRYEFIISLVGYKTQILPVVVNDKTASLQIIMEENILNDETAMVIGQKKDRSEELIKNVIRNKEKNRGAIKNYSASVYIKASEELLFNKKTKIIKSEKITPEKKSADSLKQIMNNRALAEIQMQLDVQFPNKIKETRTGVKKLGNPDGLFYTSTMEGDFSLYNNLMSIRALGPTPFLSPISYSGLIAYKFKTIRTIKQQNRTFYTIQFKPTKLGNALLEGEVEIMDSSWVIVNSQFSLPKYHLNEYDYFSVEQEYQLTNDSIWLFKKQQFSYNAKEGKNSKNGITKVFYNEYELNKSFPPKYFGMELSSTSAEAYEKDSTFWQTVRSEPLTAQELSFVRYKDSLLLITTSQAYLDSIDAKTNKITVRKVLLDGLTFYNRKKEREIILSSLSNMLELFQPGGVRVGYSGGFNKTFKNKKDISAYAEASYGVRNQDVNGYMRFTRTYNPFNRGNYYFSIGRNFDFLFPGDVFVNAFQKRNIFRKTDFSVGHRVEILNGLFINNDFEIARRNSIDNFKFYDWSNISKDTLFLNFIDSTNSPRSFPSHSALYNSITLSYTPFQKYMREPLQKVILGSKWPTFSIRWRKGIPRILGSAIDYDYFEFRINQTLQLGTVGISRYNFVIGSFGNRDSIILPDRKFMRGRDPVLFFAPETNFQHLPETFEITQRFIEGHYLHEFNGAIFNKIPVFKKLQLKEIVGGGFLFVPERKLRYFELFAGFETKPFRILKDRFKLGLFAVGSVSNQFSNPIEIKFNLRQWDRKGNRWL